MGGTDNGAGGHRGAGRFSARRRTVLVGGIAAAALSTVAALPGLLISEPQAEAADSAYDPLQRFLTLVGIGNGQLLAVQADGHLLWYRDADWANASGAWTSGSGRVIDAGWAAYTSVMGSTDGSVYALTGDGKLFRHHYTTANLTTGEGKWDAPEQIDRGWDSYVEVFGFDGDLYGRTPDGVIHAFHYDTASHQFTSRSRPLVGDFKSTALFADTGGVLYTLTDSLRWYKQIDGVWQSGSGKSIHPGLGNLSAGGIFFTGEGTVYCVPTDLPWMPANSTLMALRLNNYSGPQPQPSWANGGRPHAVGNGWSVEPMAALQGYPLTHSVTSGQTIQFAVSTTFAHYSWSVVSVGGKEPTPVSPPVHGTAKGAMQVLTDSEFLATGCAWDASVSVNTASLRTGLYALRLEGPSGLTRDIPFVVNPAPGARKAPIAFLLPVLTHHAYNPWGGHNQYCNDLNGYQRPLNVNRPSKTKHLTPTGYIEHTMYSDVMLLQWFRDQGLEVDLYDDLDLHADPNLFEGYSIAVMGSHPEYWSLDMRQGLSDYLLNGGNLVYAGGNGIYEAVDIDLTTGLVTFRTPNGKRNYLSSIGYPPSLLLAVEPNNKAFKTFAPYQVTAPDNHPLLANTGLTKGSTFGTTGYNRGASGWEMDAILPGSPGEATADQLIAHGVNQSNGGANMIYRPTGNGGHVFSASSISFVGALASDQAQSTLFRNVFNEMLKSAATRPPAGTRMKSVPMVKVAPVAPEPHPHTHAHH